MANDARESPKPLTHSLKDGCCVYGPSKEVIHGNRAGCCYCLDPDQIGDESKDGFSLVLKLLDRFNPVRKNLNSDPRRCAGSEAEMP